MTEVLHIYDGGYCYQETEMELDYDGQPMPMRYDVRVEVSVCGIEDYENNILFAYPEDTATCQNCIDEYALRLLKELDNE